MSHSYSQGYYSVPEEDYEEMEKLIAAGDFVIRKQTLRAERAEIENAVLDRSNEELMDVMQQIMEAIWRVNVDWDEAARACGDPMCEGDCRWVTVLRLLVFNKMHDRNEP